MTKTLKEFVEKVNGAPWDYETMANAVLDEVGESCDLVVASLAYVRAVKQFEEALSASGIELG